MTANTNNLPQSYAQTRRPPSSSRLVTHETCQLGLLLELSEISFSKIDRHATLAELSGGRADGYIGQLNYILSTYATSMLSIVHPEFNGANISALRHILMWVKNLIRNIWDTKQHSLYFRNSSLENVLVLFWHSKF